MTDILTWERTNLYPEVTEGAKCEDPSTLKTRGDKVQCDIDAMSDTVVPKEIAALNQNLTAALPRRPEELEAIGLEPNLVRLSIGCEPIGDLIYDLNSLFRG